MRPSPLFLSLVGAALISSATATQRQKPVMAGLGPAIPPSNPDEAPSDPTGGNIILYDVLSRDRSINIFAGFTRDIDTVDTRLSDGNQNTTVLAPLNSAIMALPRKPWQDPEDYKVLGEDAYEGPDGEDRAHRNLRRFVEAHIVTTSPWKENEEVETMTGDKVWWEVKGGKKIIQPGNIEVSSVASKVSNGEVWILNAARNYAR